MKIGFSNTNSPIHRLNPTLKFIAFIVIVVMIFLPLGFFAQIIIGTLLLIIYYFSKLSFRTFWNILKSAIFLFLILFFVNWIIYKDPIAVFVPNNHFAINIGGTGLLDSQFNLVGNSNNGTSYVSGLIGGNVIGFLNENGIQINSSNLTLEQIVDSQSNYSPETAEQLFNSLSVNVQDTLLGWISDKQKAIQYVWILNNDFYINGTKYSIEVLSNSLNGYLNGFSAVVCEIYWYTLSPEAIQLALYVLVKVFLMILVATILTSTTTSIGLANALEELLSPLKLFRFPVVEASMIIAIALRFVPSLISESQRVFNAQSARGVDFKNGNIRDKFRAMFSLVVPLFNIAFLKSAELANAMEVRSYSTRHSRTKYRIFKLNLIDWISFAIICLITGFLIGILVKPLIFAPFGIFELGTLIP